MRMNMNMHDEDNLQRMIHLAEEFFETKNDPQQISVDEKTRDLLTRIHPDTLSEVRNEHGPIAWVLVIPTTRELMERFVQGTIHERELLDLTPLGGTYNALYLCSALVLPEFRGRGIARDLVLKTCRSIRKDHPIRHLFYWAFSNEGKNLARTVADALQLPLLGREEQSEQQ